VVDALRWVMGEQKIRYLRGKKLEDIIFYGSEEASLVGLAEVTMVLSRSEGEVFPDPYGSSEESVFPGAIFGMEKASIF